MMAYDWKDESTVNTVCRTRLQAVRHLTFFGRHLPDTSDAVGWSRSRSGVSAKRLQHTPVNGSHPGVSRCRLREQMGWL